MTNLCIRWERIANEILMHFRAQRKLQGEVSLSDTIETGPEGDALYLSDVVGEDNTMLEELQDNVHYYHRHRRSAAFCQMAAETIDELKSAGLSGRQLYELAQDCGTDSASILLDRSFSLRRAS